jgi:hypothetical protein
VRRYLFGYHGEQIAEFVEVEGGERSDRPQLAAAMPRGARVPCLWRSSIGSPAASPSSPS